MIVKSSVHVGDLYAIDQIDNYVATGGVDNKVIIWNSLSGSVRTEITLPKARANTFINYLKFVKTPIQTILFVL